MSALGLRRYFVFNFSTGRIEGFPAGYICLDTAKEVAMKIKEATGDMILLLVTMGYIKTVSLPVQVFEEI
jgi:hypothetical protein